MSALYAVARLVIVALRPAGPHQPVERLHWDLGVQWEQATELQPVHDLASGQPVHMATRGDLAALLRRYLPDAVTAEKPATATAWWLALCDPAGHDIARIHPDGQLQLPPAGTEQPPVSTALDAGLREHATGLLASTTSATINAIGAGDLLQALSACAASAVAVEQVTRHLATVALAEGWDKAVIAQTLGLENPLVQELLAEEPDQT